MLSEDRTFQYKAELTLHRSHALGAGSKPVDDEVNWLFLREGENRFSFLYKIENPKEAVYEKSFSVDIAFTLGEEIKSHIQLKKEYQVLRGEEFVGKIKLINALNSDI